MGGKRSAMNSSYRSLYLFEIGSYQVAQDGLEPILVVHEGFELASSASVSQVAWDYRPVPPSLARVLFLSLCL